MTKATLTQTALTGPIRGRTELQAKLYPNGECVIYKQKQMRIRPSQLVRVNPEGWYFWLRYYCFNSPLSHSEALAVALGSSPLPNFDKGVLGLSSDVFADAQTRAASIKPVVRYGLRGITPSGARRVRNACHVIQSLEGRHRTVFATCTMPDLPPEQMGLLHERWHKVVDAYRRKLTRLLQSNHLSGESVTVSEIQEKRYERTGFPILHIHTVFCGKTRSGQWAVTTEAHDQMWREALAIALGDCIGEMPAACNLQRVKKSAESYLGKYMSKGVKVVKRVVADGFSGWMPKQWWSVSRSLGKRIDAQTRDIRELAEWLNDVAEIEGAGVWLWHRNVQIEMGEGDLITIARYGRLNAFETRRIQDCYSSDDSGVKIGYPFLTG